MAERAESLESNGSSRAVLFIHAQTSLHPGSGTALGTVDLPVQRERHTGWPTIPASSLKGVLRDACREKAAGKYEEERDDEGVKRSRRRVANEDDAELVTVFGPGKVDESSSHAGALALTDARILAFPVRSLRGVFAWTTCPAVLERFNRDLELADLEILDDLPKPARGEAACAERSPLLVDGNKLVLEEFDFTHRGDATNIASRIAGNAIGEKDRATRERMKMHLAILHDDDFTHFVRHATEVVARVGLDYDRKTVKQSALFYQEFLPPETIFYSLVLAEESRRKGTAMTAAEVLNYVRDAMPPVLQIGGDETIGKGLCAVHLAVGKKKGA